MVNSNVFIWIKITLPIWIPSICSFCFRKDTRYSDHSVCGQQPSVIILLFFSSVVFPRNRFILAMKAYPTTSSSSSNSLQS
ncbi:hypothetical protein HanRHA438_Chr14g0647111 [Helianthus annuus]|nr:hypothetical protein HanRHA438_Chr14g0647111 [Helianthus annuus]